MTRSFSFNYAAPAKNAEKIDACKVRVLRAIKAGNHEEKYINDYITKGALKNLSWSAFQADAIRELRNEGVISYNNNLEGWYIND